MTSVDFSTYLGFALYAGALALLIGLSVSSRRRFRKSGRRLLFTAPHLIVSVGFLHAAMFVAGEFYPWFQLALIDWFESTAGTGISSAVSDEFANGVALALMAILLAAPLIPKTRGASLFFVLGWCLTGSVLAMVARAILSAVNDGFEDGFAHLPIVVMIYFGVTGSLLFAGLGAAIFERAARPLSLGILASTLSGQGLLAGHIVDTLLDPTGQLTMIPEYHRFDFAGMGRVGHILAFQLAALPLSIGVFGMAARRST